jgi:hypothetical protein
VTESDGSSTTRFDVREIAKRAGGWARQFWVVIVLVLVGVVTSTGVTLLHSGKLSPLDEWVYVDYLYKLPEHGIVLKGEPIGEDALEIMACEGVTPYGPMGQPCGANYDYTKFPFGGITSADPYPPVFFALTRVTGDTLGFVFGVGEMEGWRLTGPLWLAATMIVFYLLLRKWRVGEVAILGLGLAFIGSPFSYWTYSYVSTDAPGFLFGALLLLLSTRFVRGQGSGWWIVLASAFAAVFKITNLLGVALAALYLLVHAIAQWRARRRGVISTANVPSAGRALLFAAVGFATAVVVQVAWLTIDRLAAVSVETGDQGVNVALNVEELLSLITAFLPGTITSNPVVAGSDGGLALPIPGWAVTPLSWICVTGVLGAFWLLRKWNARSPMVISVALGAALAAPLLAVALQVATSSYFPLPTRYGAALLPGFLLLAGFILINRWARWILVGYGALLCVALVGFSWYVARYA